MISKSSILDLLKKYNLKDMKMSGSDNVVCRCPFHDDSSASFAININNGKWICYSACCGKKGDFYRFVSLMEGITEEQAKKNIFGNNENSIFYSMLNDVDSALHSDNEEKTYPVKTKLYFANFFKFDDYRLFLDRLNITEEVARSVRFKLCTGPKFYKGRLGIQIDEDVWELRDLSGLAEKKVLYTVGTKVSELLYIGVSDFTSNKSCFLVEGTKDVLTINSFGHNACSCFGTNISKEQINKMISLGINKIFMFYDGDEAGRNASKKNFRKLANFFELIWLNCPNGKDPNDLTAKEFEKILHNI